VSHCNCCATVALVDCEVDLLQRVSGDCRYRDVVLLTNRIAQLAGCGDVFTQQRRGNTHVIQTEQWVDNDRTKVEIFANNLSVNLACRRDVNDCIAANLCSATESVALC
jgi:hypothetical protein